MQIIRITGFFLFENMQRWQFELENKILQTAVLGHIYLGINKTLTHNSLYVFDKWGEKT